MLVALTYLQESVYNFRSGKYYGNIYYISSAQAQKEENAWILGKNEFCWRPQRDQEEKEKGTETAGGVRGSKTFESLRKKGDFKSVFERGIKVSSKFLVLYALPNEHGLKRIGFAVSRKVGIAVIRNRIKRRLRESLRNIMPDVQSGYDIVIVARRSAADADFHGLNTSVLSCISELIHEKTVHKTD